ncbi:hypothetical protein TrST_g9949 [Triparma strigata]|uniref:Sugar fermentation stimulation protein C-terminal domain-containing protein n=1 Tax=Triparma strigata TaxID=1606541 RepID=A0A9W7BC94_9STRA|nr:hypothetical protein TrST_g9949 [Triparma strigata]
MRTRRGCIKPSIARSATTALKAKKTTNTATTKKKQSSLVIKTLSESTSSETVLLDLGPLVSGVVVKRPSATIRSPYVADVRLPDGSIALAHAPALDVGGLCAPGCKVLLKERPPGGKTSHSIELVYCTGPESGASGQAIVGAHPRLGEQLSKIVLERGLVEGLSGDIQGQKTLGDSRVDFVIDEVNVVEVKNVVCADYHASTAPAKRNENHCVVTSSAPISDYARAGIFPWGKVGQEFEGKKVVSERAIKHIRNLSSLLQSTKNGIETATVLFCLNRGDCKTMRACHEQDPVFASELEKARKEGVEVKCFQVEWTPEGVCRYVGAVEVDRFEI